MAPPPQLQMRPGHTPRRRRPLFTYCPHCSQNSFKLVSRYAKASPSKEGFSGRKPTNEYRPSALPTKKSKSDWGPRAWYRLHTAAIFFSHSPSEQERISVHNWIQNYASTIPCQKCRWHARSYISQHPPSTNNSENLQSWMFNFHNIVNYRLDKPIIPYDKYLTEFQDEIQKSYWTQGWTRPVRFSPT